MPEDRFPLAIPAYVAVGINARNLLSRFPDRAGPTSGGFGPQAGNSLARPWSTPHGRVRSGCRNAGPAPLRSHTVQRAADLQVGGVAASEPVQSPYCSRA